MRAMRGVGEIAERQRASERIGRENGHGSLGSSGEGVPRLSRTAPIAPRSEPGATKAELRASRHDVRDAARDASLTRARHDGQVSIRNVRLKPATPTTLDGYDLDAFAIEWDDEDPEYLDFRFELGRGLSIYWALPIARDERLRLAHVDGAGYTVDEPQLIEDPWLCDVPRLEWRGELAALADGAQLVRVSVEATKDPPRYLCEAIVRDRAGAERRMPFSWQQGLESRTVSTNECARFGSGSGRRTRDEWP